ncbi:cysteine desulfurase [Patescibacteria group bacterium]|nr:cysteine desulfurase [Patescibacteria group bacterium]MBU1931871.1 cysteine desulfurase [Patescibacteria group bacterium]
MVKKRQVYLDYAATTPVDPLVMKAMRPFFDKDFGNSMSLHRWGQSAKKALEASRQTVADFIGAEKEEIVFTASASESNNLALKGVAWANKAKGRHILISPIEHSCVQQSAQWLKQQGWLVEELTVNQYGLVDPQQVKQKLRAETILVSVIYASNEIGTIQPIKAIAEVCQAKKVYCHTDASQACGQISLNVKDVGVDLLTASSHKIYGPKGAAILYIKDGVKIEPLIHGGGHEAGRRAATVNLPAIVGLAQAVKLADGLRIKDSRRIAKLRDYLIQGILSRIPHSYLNGHPKQRLPNNVHFRFDFIEGEALVFALDQQGIAASTGSACSSAELKPSKTLLAIGLKPEQTHGSLRLSLGRRTTKKELDYVLQALPEVVTKLRKASPFK